MPHKNPIIRKEYQRLYQQKWRIKNKEKWDNILKKSDKKRYNTPKRKLTLSEVRKRVLHRFKTKVLEMYGKECKYCGIDKYEVLCIDHIQNDGKFHRKSEEFKKYSNMWGYLAKTKFCPEQFQTLCWNCNMAKEHYKIYPNGNSHKPFQYWVELSKKKNGK